MDRFKKDVIDGLLERGRPPCLSLYQRTRRHHPDNKQDPIRYVNLISDLEDSLHKKYPQKTYGPLLDRFRALADNDDFWNHTLDGLAVVGAEGLFRVYQLPRPVPNLAVVADTFHIKPLLRHVQSTDRYNVLGLDRENATLYEGTRYSIAKVHLHEDIPSTLEQALGSELTDPHRTVASYGGAAEHQGAMHHGHGGRKDQVDLDAERFFRAVDKGLLEHHTQLERLPLIVAALPEHQSMFRKISSNPNLMKEGIDVHPASFESKEALQRRAWQVMEPHILKNWNDIINTYKEAAAHGRGTERIEDVVRETVHGRVDTLLIDAHREIPGRIQLPTGKVETDDLTHPEVDDVLDDLASMVLKKGGKVLVLPHDRIPTETGVAAVLRW
jgi:hypothetical protein